MFIFITLMVIFLIVVIVLITNINKSTSNICKEQKDTNVKANITLKNMKFNATKIFYLNDCNTYDQLEDCKKFIAVDVDNKQICLINYEKGNMLIVGFDEILNYEIFENGSKLTTGGNIYGYGGGLFEAETNDMCKDLKLIIRLKRYNTSQVSYNIIFDTIFNTGLNKSTYAYKQCISTLQEVVSFLEVIKNENQANTKSTNE